MQTQEMTEKYFGSSLTTLVEIKVIYYEKPNQITFTSTFSSHCYLHFIKRFEKNKNKTKHEGHESFFSLGSLPYFHHQVHTINLSA